MSRIETLADAIRADATDATARMALADALEAAGLPQEAAVQREIAALRPVANLGDQVREALIDAYLADLADLGDPVRREDVSFEDGWDAVLLVPWIELSTREGEPRSSGKLVVCQEADVELEELHRKRFPTSEGQS